jgi:hypothetical protein
VVGAVRLRGVGAAAARPTGPAWRIGGQVTRGNAVSSPSAQVRPSASGNGRPDF